MFLKISNLKLLWIKLFEKKITYGERSSEKLFSKNPKNSKKNIFFKSTICGKQFFFKKTKVLAKNIKLSTVNCWMLIGRKDLKNLKGSR